MAIYSGFTRWKWWCSIAMLNCQRVHHGYDYDYETFGPPNMKLKPCWNFWVFLYNDLTVTSHWESCFFIWKSFPFMAKLFRLANYDNVPRRNRIWYTIFGQIHSAADLASCGMGQKMRIHSIAVFFFIMLADVKVAFQGKACWYFGISPVVCMTRHETIAFAAGDIECVDSIQLCCCSMRPQLALR